MSTLPANYQYTDTHEWLRRDDDGLYSIGITEHAQKVLGDMVYIELPKVGQCLQQGKECGVVESVKAASDIYAPVAGTVVEVNEFLLDMPTQINQSPYDKGWVLRLELSDVAQLTSLLDADAYQTLLDQQD